MRLALAFILLLSGYAGADQIIKQMAQDKASACVHLSAMLYGNATYCRTNEPGSTVIFKGGKMAIQHGMIK